MRRVPDVIAEKAHGKYTTAIRAGDATRRMQCEHVKTSGVAQVGEILVDAGAKHRHFLRPKQLSEAHGAVTLKSLDDFAVNHVGNARSISSRSTGPR
jgi:hypothetical protein